MGFGTSVHLHPLHPAHVGTDERSRRPQESLPPPLCLPLSGLTHLSLTLNPESHILFCFGSYGFPNVHRYQNKSSGLFLEEVKSSLI